MTTVARHRASWQPERYQGNLFALDDPAVDGTFSVLERIWLDSTSWVDIAPRWMLGADVVFGDLVDRLSWGQREVVMYDHLRPEPRLTSWWSTRVRSSEPLPVLTEARAVLTRHYNRPFDSIGFNLYRDGRDSVAWHGDRERYRHEDPVVAIVSVGSPRSFQLRRRERSASGGVPSRAFTIAHGDLLVMGGACQHDWEHCVPKTARPVGPRLSIMFRHDLVSVGRRGYEQATVNAARAKLSG